jgi:hypothetical protein
MEQWDSRFKIMREDRMFAGISREKIQDADVVRIMDLNDQYNGSSVVVLKFG